MYSIHTNWSVNYSVYSARRLLLTHHSTHHPFHWESIRTKAVKTSRESSSPLWQQHNSPWESDEQYRQCPILAEWDLSGSKYKLCGRVAGGLGWWEAVKEFAIGLAVAGGGCASQDSSLVSAWLCEALPEPSVRSLSKRDRDRRKMYAETCASKCTHTDTIK